MTIDELMLVASTLTPTEQAKLIAFLVQQRNRRDPAYLAELQERIDDRDPTHWLTPDEFDRRLDAM